MTFIDWFADEEWKDVVGFEGRYKVSTYGRVWSVAREVRQGGKTGTVMTKDMLLAQRRDQKGYMRVYLNEKGKTRFVPVHRLVAKAFIPNPKGKPQVNHIDGDKTNNYVTNLEWCTNGENQRHAFKHGLNRVTGRAGRKKIPIEMVDSSSGNVVAVYESINDASAHTKIAPQNIRKVLIGNRKHAGGYSWRKVVIGNVG